MGEECGVRQGAILHTYVVQVYAFFICQTRRSLELMGAKEVDIERGNKRENSSCHDGAMHGTEIWMSSLGLEVVSCLFHVQ